MPDSKDAGGDGTCIISWLELTVRDHMVDIRLKMAWIRASIECHSMLLLIHYDSFALLNPL